MHVHIFQRHHECSFSISTDYLSTNFVCTEYVRYKLKVTYFYQFVTVDSHTVPYTQCTGKVMTYCHTKFNIYSSNGLAVITIKLKAKGILKQLPPSSFCILQKQQLNNTLIFI